MLTRDPEPWPDHIPSEPGPPPPARVGPDALRVTFVGHATVLVQTDGLNLLCDPVWSDRVGPLPWPALVRKRDPGLRFEDLPPIDAVLVSHNHYDHLDLPTLRRLAERDRPRFLVPLGNAPLLAVEGIGRVEEMDWWEVRALTDRVRVHAVPSQHTAMRGLGDRAKTLWCGFVIEGPAGPVHFAGDTGFSPHFAWIRERFGPMRVALLPIGAYLPRWFMAPVHLSPGEAVWAHLDLAAATTIPIHYGTFPAADDGPDRPLADLRAALGARPDLAPAFIVLDPGQAWTPEASSSSWTPPPGRR